MAERWHSVEEVAVHLGLAQDTIYRWIERRGLPAHRVGKLWKLKLDEVDAWVREGGSIAPESRPSRTERTARPVRRVASR